MKQIPEIILKDAIDNEDSQIKRMHVADITNEILLRICSLQYHPGLRLSEAALAQEFGVSRTPVRQVLQQLSVLGLVKSLNGVGTVVTELKPKQAQELSLIRRHLAKLLAVMTEPSQFEQARQHMLLLEQDAASLYFEMNTQKYAHIGLMIHRILISTVKKGEFRELWEQNYFKHCRLSYGLIEKKWTLCVELQCEEIAGLAEAFASKNPEKVASTMNHFLLRWADLAGVPSLHDFVREMPGL